MIIRGGQALLLPASLATPHELGCGVTDIEGLCERAASHYLRRRSAFLDTHDTADLASFLMLAAWTEAGRYQPRDQGSSLKEYLWARLQWRCTDWYRSRFGRSTRPRPVILSLDEIRAGELLEPDCA